MYKTSEKYKQLVYEDSTTHLLTIYIDGKKVDPDHIFDFKVSHALFSNDEFCLGSVTAKTIEMRIHKNSLPDSYNSFFVLTGVDKSIVPIGYFLLDSIDKNDDDTVTIKAIDHMVKFEFNYDGSDLTYPATMIEVLQDICLKAGVAVGSTSFLNSDKQIAVYDNTVSAREYLSYIAEQAGGFAIIGRDKKLYIRTIGQDTSEVNIELFQDYTWGEQFKVSRVAYEDGIQDFKFGDETNNTVWINSDNMYIVDSEQVENIFNQLEDFECYSFEGSTIIDPSLDIGDVIVVDNKRVIFQGDMEYVGKFKASISSKIQVKQKEETSRTVISEKAKIRRVQSEINQLDGKITQLVQETGEFDEKFTKVEQDIESVNQKVSNVADFTRISQGNNEVKLNETIDGRGYVLNLTIKGSTDDFVYLPPYNGLTPSDNLVPLGGHFTLVSDKQNRSRMSNEAEITRVDLEEPLRNLGDVCDEFKIIKGKASVTRRIGVNDDLSLYILENEVVEEIEGELELKTFEDTTYIYVQEYYNLAYESKYIIKNEFSENYVTNYEAVSMINQSSNKIEETVRENFATKNELIQESSQRIQTAQEIKQEVSRKVGDDEVISKINQSAEEIQIEANKISLKRKRTKFSR